MTFPCLVCGDLPVVDQPGPLQQPTSVSGAGVPAAAPLSSGGRLNSNNNNASNNNGGYPSTTPVGTGGGGKKSGGATIRTLSKDVSDKIFQNLCRHLYVKTEPYWFIQNPGEQMPLCAFCSGVVLEIYTLQTKVDQFQAMIKKLVWKLERIVADTEIAGNWMATREEQEGEEEMWNSIPCPPMAVRIARERHHKFRLQILQNFKCKVKLRQKMRAAGQQLDEIYDMEPSLTGVSLADTVFDNGERERCTEFISSLATASPQNPTPSKKARLDDNGHHQSLPGLIRAHLTQNTLPARSSPPVVVIGSSSGITSVANMTRSTVSSSTSLQQATQQVKIPSTISVSAVVASGREREQHQEEEEYMEESELEDEPNSQVYPDVQIVCSAGPADFLKEEHDYTNSNSGGDGEDSVLEQDASYWNSTDDTMDDVEAMTIADGEDVVWLAPGLAIRKSFVNQLLSENLKPSVFLRKLVFAVFGMKQVANSSGICGSNKPGAKPSLDRYKFEALREYTIETYGIRDNIAELEDLNRKIRTICCDARKALKRKNLKTIIAGSSGIKIDSLSSGASGSSFAGGVVSSANQHHHHHHSTEGISPASLGTVPDLFHLATTSLNGCGPTRDATDEEDDHQLPHLPVSVTIEEHPGEEEEDEN